MISREEVEALRQFTDDAHWETNFFGARGTIVTLCDFWLAAQRSAPSAGVPRERIDHAIIESGILGEEIAKLRGLLLRIRAWDMMDSASDGVYWRKEIDAAISAGSTPATPPLSHEGSPSGPSGAGGSAGTLSAKDTEFVAERRRYDNKNHRGIYAKLVRRAADHIEALSRELADDKSRVPTGAATSGPQGAGGSARTPNNDEVICPNCVHQFRAIPVNVQEQLRAVEARAEAMEKDAARYRYIRDTPWAPNLRDVLTLHRNALWDAAIDAALAAKRTSNS